MEALWILLVPLSWLIIAKVWLRTTFNWKEFAISFGVVTLLVTATVLGSKWGATQDTEIWNGQITAKKMVDDYYQTSYDCNCTTDSEGNTSCDTCYTDHYTREYNGHSTVGNWTFASIDSEWRSTRDSFKPTPAYINCKVGEPASREHSYTNYVQAVPQSLFHDASKTAEQFAGQIPAYPRVHSFYKINRVLNVGSTVPAELQNLINTQLNEGLKTLGATKQVNIIVVLTNIQDPTYRYAIENAWLGAEKNDVVVIVGITGENFIGWVDVMTWALNSGNELFHVTLRDTLTEIGTVNRPEFVPAILQTIKTTYDRPQMKDYEYLENEIEVPTWAFWLAMFFAFGGSAILTLIFHKHELR